MNTILSVDFEWFVHKMKKVIHTDCTEYSGSKEINKKYSGKDIVSYRHNVIHYYYCYSFNIYL